MISQKTIDFFKQTTPQLDFQLHFQDFTDDQVRNAYAICRPNTAWGLLDYLYDHTADKEIRAHIRGFKDYAHRRSALIRCAVIIATHDVKTKDELVEWWNTYADPENQLTDEEIKKVWNRVHENETAENRTI